MLQRVRCRKWNFTHDMSEEEEEPGEWEDNGKSDPSAIFLSNCRAPTLQKYLISFDVSDNMLAALSSIKKKMIGSAESEATTKL